MRDLGMIQMSSVVNDQYMGPDEASRYIIFYIFISITFETRNLPILFTIDLLNSLSRPLLIRGNV